MSQKWANFPTVNTNANLNYWSWILGDTSLQNSTRARKMDTRESGSHLKSRILPASKRKMRRLLYSVKIVNNPTFDCWWGSYTSLKSLFLRRIGCLKSVISESFVAVFMERNAVFALVECMTVSSIEVSAGFGSTWNTKFSIWTILCSTKTYLALRFCKCRIHRCS